jgi:hypothetical protein
MMQFRSKRSRVINMRRHYRFVGLTVAILAIAQPCAAINIVLDYTYDSFFATHLTAKNTLIAAAQDLSNAITSTLNPTSDTSSGISGTATTTFNFNFSFRDPSTNPSPPMGTPIIQESLDPAVMPMNQIRIYVGAYNLGGNTLGVGGPGTIGGSASYSGNLSDVPNSVQAAAAAASSNMTRSGGPIINRVSGSFQGVPSSNYTINYGAAVGSLTFDVDSNNDGVADSDAMLNSYWQFDRNAPVGPAQNDFYTVALHEMMHAIGFGGSLSWSSLLSGSQNWLGSQVIALEKTGNNVVAPDG